jgi:hypothetical protein
VSGGILVATPDDHDMFTQVDVALDDSGDDPRGGHVGRSAQILRGRAGGETQRRPDAVHALIRLGADVHARDRSGATPLFLAAEGGRGSAVRALLAAGADPAARNNLGESAVYIAALKAGRDHPNRNPYLKTPLDLNLRP